MKGFVDFKQVSSQVLFKTLLDHLNVLYQETEKEIKGEIEGWKFIVNKGKNLFFSPNSDRKGSVVNFFSEAKGVDLREAAFTIKRLFLDEKKIEREIPELTLTYTPEIEKLGLSEATCKDYEIGVPTGRTIMAKKIAFKLYDQSETFMGYIGKKPDGWFYPKGFTRSFLYNGYRSQTDYCILVPDPLDCVMLCQLGFKFSIAIMGLSPTDPQLELLKRYKRILLIHKAPENTVLKLSGHSFVKACTFEITKTTTKEEIKALY